MLIELAKVLALFLSLTLLLSFLFRSLGQTSVRAKLVIGALFGLIAVIGMSSPVHLAPGTIIDPRSVVVSLSSFFFGPASALASLGIAAGYRIYLGGEGAAAGVAMLTIASLMGLFFYYLREASKINVTPIHLLIMGLVTNSTAFAGILLLPTDIIWQVFERTYLLFFALFPMATMLLGLLIQYMLDRFELEQALHLSEQRFRTLVESMPDLVWLKDPDGVYLSCNKRFESVFNVSQNKIIGKRDRDFVGEVLAQKYKESDREAVARGGSMVHEEWITFANDGHKELLEKIKTPIYDAQGKLVGILGIGRDITKQKLNEEALIKGRNQAANILQGTNAGTWDWNIKTGELSLNDRWSEIIGYRLEELHPVDIRTWQKVLHPDDFAFVQTALDRHFNGQSDYYDVEFRQRHKDGHWVWVNARGRVVEWSDSGEPLRMSGTHLDISKRKQAEERLIESEKLFRDVFLVSPVAASICAVEGGHFYEVNDAYTATFGWTTAELLAGESVTIGLWPDVNERNEWIAALRKAGLVNDYPVKLKNKAGEIRDVSLSACLIDYDDAHCVLTMLHDVTERKQAEDELRESEDRFRLLFDNAGVSIWNEDFTALYEALDQLRDEGMEDLRNYLKGNDSALTTLANKVVVRQVNHATLQLFGAKSQEEFLPNIGDTFGEGALDVFADELCAIWDGDSHFQSEVRFLSLDGRDIDAIISLPLPSSAKDVSNVPVSLHDISKRKDAERALIQSQSRYRTILDSMDEIGEGIFIVGSDYKVEFMNQTMKSWFGNQVGKVCYEAMPGLQDKCDHCKIKEVIENNQTVHYQPTTPSGQSFEIVGTPIQNPDGSVSKLEIFRDISQRKENERRIQTLSQVVEQSPVSVLITDLDGNINYVNSTFEKVTGYSANEVIGQNPRILKSGKTPKVRYQELWSNLNSGKRWQGEFQNRKKNGDIFWERAHLSPVLDENGEIYRYLAVKEDITLHKQQEQRILHQAHFDNLTELPNRFLALDRLSQLIKEASRSKEHVAVLFLDLDDFKKVNDTMGHEVGDKLLVQAADRLRDTVREEDTIGRLGGDEFIVLLGDLGDVADAGSVAENLLDRFRDPFNLDGRELVLTASVGIAVYPEDGKLPNELLRNADTAMYHSKEEGRNTYHYFTEAMNKGVSRRLIIEEQLRGALGRGEFWICYQPQVDIQTRQIMGVEALLRWSNPALGEVSPVEFIPIAEQTGLIVSIGQYVLVEALKMATHWNLQLEKEIKVAVNLSPRQFRDPHMTNFVEHALVSSGIEPELLELEITEGVLMSGHAYIDEALATLNQMGITIAMDDFGTGYSSLSYLRSYPFDVLKIDRSFINDITVDSADRELINAAIAMAHGLGLSVVAEGVETEEQLSHLARHQCDFAQGYLFSKPVPAKEITAMLQDD